MATVTATMKNVDVIIFLLKKGELLLYYQMINGQALLELPCVATVKYSLLPTEKNQTKMEHVHIIYYTLGFLYLLIMNLSLLFIALT